MISTFLGLCLCLLTLQSCDPLACVVVTSHKSNEVEICIVQDSSSKFAIADTDSVCLGFGAMRTQSNFRHCYGIGIIRKEDADSIKAMIKSIEFTTVDSTFTIEPGSFDDYLRFKRGGVLNQTYSIQLKKMDKQ